MGGRGQFKKFSLTKWSRCGLEVVQRCGDNSKKEEAL